MRIEEVKVASLKPHPNNVRVHDEDNLVGIMKSLEAFGQRTPIVVGSGNFVIKGCGTLEALKRLGKETVLVVRANDLSQEHQLAYALADNKTSDLSEFDFQGVAGVLKELQAVGLNLEATGFRAFEIEPLLQAEWKPPTAEFPKDAGQKPGKLEFSEAQIMVIEQAKRAGVLHQIIPEGARLTDAVEIICRNFLQSFPLPRPVKKS